MDVVFKFLYIILPVPRWAYYLYPCHGKSHQITSQSRRKNEKKRDLTKNNGQAWEYEESTPEIQAILLLGMV